MSSISSSTYASVGTSSNGGISGLMSGMDTDAMVTALLSATQAKIDAKTGEQAQLEMKQELYRQVIDSINNFKNSFFDTSYGSSLTTNLASSSFWNSLTSNVTGLGNIDVVSTSSSATANSSYEIAVKQLATTTSLSTGNTLSGDNSIIGSELTSDMLSSLANSADLTLDIDVNGSATSITIDLNGCSSTTEVSDKISAALVSAGIDTDSVSVSADGGTLAITSQAGTTVSVDKDNSDDLALQYTGLTSTTSTDKTETTTEEVDGEDVETETVLSTTLTATNAGDFSSNVIDFTLSYDGVSKTITLNNLVASDPSVGLTADDVLSSLQAEVKEAFGSYVDVSLTADNELKFSVAADETGHELKITGIDANDIGFVPGSTSLFDTNNTLESLGVSNYDFSINGVDFSFGADTTIASMISTINKSNAGVTMSYSSISDRIKIEANETGAGYDIEIDEADGGILGTLFGVDSANLSSNVEQGNDALLTINGVDTSRSSNTFEIDGITMTVTEVSSSSTQTVTEKTLTESYDEMTGETSYEVNEVEVEKTVYDTSTITTARDVDKIVEGVQAFIDGYNELIAELNDLVGADKTYRDYAPLTDAQKAEMSETEITLWNEKTNEGLLSNDTYINTFLSQMRSALYQSGGSGNLAIYQFGIETSSDYTDNGKLVFDEATFRSAYASNAVDIADLFTNTVDGLASSLMSAMTSIANESSGSPGTLVSIAGIKGSTTESTCSYYSQLATLSSRIETLQAQYETEKTRYWSQFTTMETTLSNYNTQSSLFTQTY
ncbi:MAG: flagellar filament capping protein FliD [Clostridia bacterium]